MKIAVIDCGTNTFNLLIAEADRNGWIPLFENKIPVKLGAGGFQNRQIIPSRFIRGIDALYCHSQNLLNYDCSEVHAVATSAIREADNGKEFVEYAANVSGIKILVIDGEKEAALIHSGIVQTLEMNDTRCLLMDIGGGSTEFIIADKSGILWKKSYLLGVSRLFEQIKCSDKMNHEDINKLRGILGESLADLKQEIARFDCQWLVGSSGSFDTILALYRQASNQMEAPVLPANDIDIASLPTLHHKLISSTLEERLMNPVIPSIRAEYMPLASYLVKFVLELHPFKRLIHSSNSLKEGLMREIVSGMDWDKIEKQSPAHPPRPENDGPDI